MNRGEEGGLRFESGVCSCVSCSETFTGLGGVTLKSGGFHFFNENNKSLVHPVFDLMMKLWPLWHEEAGSHSLISEQDIIDWHRGMDVETDFFYSMFVPPHLEKLIGENLKSLVSVTDKVFGQMPWVCRLGGFISGSVKKLSYGRNLVEES